MLFLLNVYNVDKLLFTLLEDGIIEEVTANKLTESLGEEDPPSNTLKLIVLTDEGIKYIRELLKEKPWHVKDVLKYATQISYYASIPLMELLGIIYCSKEYEYFTKDSEIREKIISLMCPHD